MDQPAATSEVVVVAPRLPEAAGEEAYSSYAIDEDSLTQALRLDDALGTAPGVSLFRRNDSGPANATTQGISIRAIAPSGAGRALVTLDGQPLNDPFGGWVLWGAIPPETISGARIVRGAGAGPYGAGALTGTIDLSERRGQGAMASAEAGGDGYTRASALGEADNDHFSLMLAAGGEHSDGWFAVRDGRGAADTRVGFETIAGVARAQWRGNGLVFAARLSGYNDERSAGLVGANSASSSTSLSLSLAAPAGAVAWRAQAWAIQSDLANSSVSVAPDRSSTTPANNQYATPAFGWGANAAVRWGVAASGLELGADVRAADGETQEQFSFSGGQFTRSRVAGGRTLIAGLYLEGWRESGDWLFSGGVRADNYRAYDGHRLERIIATQAVTLDVSPADYETTTPTARIGARRAFGENYFRAAAYSGFRPPTLNELHRPFRVGNDVTEANPGLKPERLYGADFGVGGEHAHWSWDAGVFATRLEDAIVNVTLGAGPGTFPPGVFVPAGGAYRQRQNAGRIDAAGVEANARGDWGDALSWRAALDVTHARVDGGSVAPSLTGLRPAQSPKWSATAGMSWRLAPMTQLSADASYESARFDDDLNTRTLSAATVVNVRLDQRLSGNLTAFAALDNAFDADVETAVTADGVYSLGPPQTLRVGLSFATAP